MSESDGVPECLTCGTCCFSTLETYVRVTGDDYERLGDAAGSLTHFVGTKCYLRMHDGHCAALVVEPETGRFVCSLYERRPLTCRELERGSPECAGERATKGERAVYALRIRRENDPESGPDEF